MPTFSNLRTPLPLSRPDLKKCSLDALLRCKVAVASLMRPLCGDAVIYVPGRPISAVSRATRSSRLAAWVAHWAGRDVTLYFILFWAAGMGEVGRDSLDMFEVRFYLQGCWTVDHT